MTCRVVGCGRSPLTSELCEQHLRGWLVSPELARVRRFKAQGRQLAAVADFLRRAEAEDRVDALRAKGAMAEAERALSAEQRPHLHRF